MVISISRVGGVVSRGAHNPT